MHWHDMVLTNVLGAAYTVRAAIPALKAVAGPRAADRLGRGPPGDARQPLLVHEVGGDGDGRGRSVDLNDTGIRTTLISPGAVDTPFFDNPSEGRLEPDDIARAVCTPCRSRRTSTSTRSWSARPPRRADCVPDNVGAWGANFHPRDLIGNRCPRESRC